MPGVKRSQSSSSKPPLPARWRLEAGDYVVAVSFAPDGSACALGTGAGEVLLVDSLSGAVRWREQAHSGGLLTLAFSPVGGLLATAGQDGKARLFGLEGQRLAELPGGSAWVEHLAWTQDGSKLATAAGRTVRLWSREGQALLETEKHESTVTGVQWSRNGDRLATSCYGGVRLWPVAEGAQAQHLPWKGSLISLAWSPDNLYLACGSQDCSVHFWRLASGQDSEMTGYPAKPKALSWSATSTLLATSGADVVLVWDFSGKGPEGTAPLQLKGHKALCSALAFSPEQTVLASGSEDSSVLVWEPRRAQKPVERAALEDAVTCLAWHPRGQGLLGADAQGNACLWSLQV